MSDKWLEELDRDGVEYTHCDPYGDYGTDVYATLKRADYDRLIACVRELQAQAALDAAVVEAASVYGEAIEAADTALVTAQRVEATRALRLEAGLAYRRFVAALAARGKGAK